MSQAKAEQRPKSQKRTALGLLLGAKRSFSASASFNVQER
jgi:hypothetical protein